MKFLCERDAFKDALGFAGARARNPRIAIPILKHVLLEADRDRLTLTGHDLDSAARVSIPAEIREGGVCTIPGEHLSRLVGALPAGAQVQVETESGGATVKGKHAHYRLPVLSADEFPPMLAPENPQTFEIAAKDVKRLFSAPRHVASTGAARHYLNGVYLHSVKEGLAVCGTDGFSLIRLVHPCDVELDPGIIVPSDAVDDIVALAGQGTLRFSFSNRILSVEGETHSFATKLVEATFPDYSRIVPPAQGPGMLVDCAEMLAAVRRLGFLASHEKDVVDAIDLSWTDSPSEIKATIRSSDGSAGQELIACEGDGAGQGNISFKPEIIARLLSAVDAEMLRLFVIDQGTPMRLTDPNDSGFVAMQAAYQSKTANQEAA